MMPAVSDMTSFKWATVTSLFPLAIRLDGDTAPLAMVPDSLVDPTTLSIGSRVRVELTDRKCVIHGSYQDGNTSLETHAVLNMDPSVWWWYHENHSSNSSDPYAPPVAHKTSLSLVMLEGLITSRVAIPVGTVIATLPPAFRPLQRKRFTLSDAGTSGWGVSIETDGRILMTTAMGAGLLLSLSGIVYNNDPTLPRRVVPYLGTWSAVPGEPVLQVAVDALGRIFYEGCVASNGLTPGTYVAQLNAGEYNSVSGQLLLGNEFGSGGPMRRFDAPASPVGTSLGRISVGIPNLTANSKMAFDAISFNDTTNSLWTALSYTSGTNYGSGWQAGGMWHAPDGAVHLRGLGNFGAPTQSIAYIMGAMNPRYRQLFLSENADTYGRFDIAAATGIISNPTGKAGFYNMNHMTWWPLPIQAR